ncbi:hypothetical protein HMSSN036_30650 [Paenibacillus macerans]|nr:hypothetical protein HMSSN036_30650 [Paenibacillus macerans]
MLTGRRRFMLWLAAGAAALLLSFGLRHRTPEELQLAQLAVYGGIAAGLPPMLRGALGRIKGRAMYEKYPQ